MKKKLLLWTAMSLAGFSLSAEVKVYSFEELGEINGISDNGHYGAITDPDFGCAYLWSESDPGKLLEITAIKGVEGNYNGADDPDITTANDVSDDGIVVGSIQFGAVSHPAYYKDGEWHLLPMDANAKNTNEAVCITPDGKIIAGYHFVNDPAADTGGRFYPCQWFLEEDGSYKLKSYTNITLPDHQGFYPMSQTPDGEIIAGTVYCGVQSRINAYIKNGEMIIFDEIRTESEPWMFRGKYYAGLDENGKQVWVEDLDDPRVVYFPEVYINGYKDGAGALEGFFDNCDASGNLYGARCKVESVNEEGEGTISSHACIYNYKTEDWHVDKNYGFFSAGVGTTLLFTSEGYVVTDNDVTTLSEAYNTPANVVGVSKISSDGRVLGAVSAELNPAIGEMMYYPVFVVTKGESGIREITGSPAKGLVVCTAGCIEVLNTEDVAVYDLKGCLISKDKVTFVAPGVYVVKAGQGVYKVSVR